MNDETIMETCSQTKKRLVIVVFLVMGFLISSSISIAMPLYMDSDECMVVTVCEKCCLISVPELSGLQHEYSFSACPDRIQLFMSDPVPLPFDHPPQ
jgi:hypothetical protein